MKGNARTGSLCACCFRKSALIIPLATACLLLIASQAAAFCEKRTDGSTCHVHIVETGLDFLRPKVLAAVSDEVIAPDHTLTPATEDHFDNCDFNGGVARIREQYEDPGLGVISRLSPYDNLVFSGKDHAEIFPAAERWAWALHTAQDFYAHSNWIEMGYQLPATDLVAPSIGPWPDIPSNWGLFRDDILASENNLPDGWSIFTKPFGRIPVVTKDNGQRFRLLVSGEGEFPHPLQDCPDEAELTHTLLNKDNINRPYHDTAAAMAVGQTRQEWCSLLYMSKAENGLPGAAVPMGLMVDIGASPHPAGTPCAPLAEGPIDVRVTPTRIRVLDDLDSESPGEINIVFTLFTDNFRRSVRTQSPTRQLNSGETLPVGALPDALDVCINPTERLVATFQGWDDDDGDVPRGDLDSTDDILAGATHVLGTGWQLEGGLGLGSFALRSDNSSNQDLEISFTVATLSHVDPDNDGLNRCEELKANTNPDMEDSDGDGLLDGHEVALGTDPNNRDSDNDGLEDGEELSLDTNPNRMDTDGDGLSDGREVNLGTDPLDPATDLCQIGSDTDVFSQFPVLDDEHWHFSGGGTTAWRVLAPTDLSLSSIRFGDFDGDGRTDVFHALPLADGSFQWRYSSAGQTDWINLGGPGKSLKTLRFGDFDGDGKTDVFDLFQRSPKTDFLQWRISSGGESDWQNMNGSDLPSSQIRFGDFDGDGKMDVFSIDSDTGSDRWRYSSGGATDWIYLARSRPGQPPLDPKYNIPITQMRFGDFNGDGKTDIFSVIAEDSFLRWRYHRSTPASWSNLNRSSVPLEDLRFGDFDADGITDVFSVAPEQGEFRWRFSSAGVANWRNLGRYDIALDDLHFGDFDAGEGCTNPAPEPEPAQAGFSATPVIGTAPLLVEFTDSSSGRVGGWRWDFGDGTTSEEQNPSHLYRSIGTYTVSLVVDGLSGNDKLTQADYISVTGTGSPDEFEPDDVAEQANPILFGVPQPHTLFPAGDMDWVKFTLSSAGDVVLETAGDSGDTQLWLYNVNDLKQWIAFDDDAGSGEFSKISRPALPAGTYLVKVSENGNDDQVGPYSILLTTTGSGVCFPMDSPPAEIPDDVLQTRTAYQSVTSGAGIVCAAKSSISAHTEVIVSPNADLTYAAPRIKLGAGFQVNAGATFKAGAN